MKKAIDFNKHSKESLNRLYKQGIYSISHIKKPNIFYVGFTTSRIYNKIKAQQGFRGRWSKHITDLRKNKHHSKYLQNIYNKYGENGLRFKILEIIRKPSRFVLREKFWIKKLNSYKNGYNATIGGPAPMLGQKGGNHPQSKIIYQYNLDGKYIKEFSSVTEAAQIYKTHPTSIGNAASSNKKTKTSHGYQWSYKYQGIKIKPVKSHRENFFKQIQMLDKNTNKILKTFKCVTDAANYVNTHKCNISRSTKKDNLSCRGYKWKYIEESN